MSTRFWPLATLLLGLVTMAAFVWLGVSSEVAAVYTRTEMASAVSAFQRAETPADLAAVFGAPPNPAIVAAQDVINTRDLYLFIPAYALFLAAAALMLGGRTLPAWSAVGLAFLGAGFDVLETLRQLRVTADLNNPGLHLPIAPWHWAKYLGLGLNGAAIAAICLLGARRRWIMGVLALAPLPIVLASWAGAVPTRAFALAFGAYWIALLVIAAIELARGRGASA